MSHRFGQAPKESVRGEANAANVPHCMQSPSSEGVERGGVAGQMMQQQHDVHTRCMADASLGVQRPCRGKSCGGSAVLQSGLPQGST